MTLPAFPVDDLTLDAVEHALGYALTHDDETGELVGVGAEFGLEKLLDFLSGYDPSKLQPAVGDDGHEHDDIVVYPDPLYHPNDVIAALITEVRRLRGMLRAL